MLDLMPRLIMTVLIAGSGWFVFSRYQIAGLDEIHLRPKEPVAVDKPQLTSTVAFSAATETATRAPSRPPDSPNADVSPLLIGLFHLDRLTSETLLEHVNLVRTAELLEPFDLVAIQGITAGNENMLREIVAALRNSDRTIAFGPRAGQQRLAFVYDARRLALDRQQMYSLSDPDDLMPTDALVGWFRALEVNVADAWTFSVVNVPVEQPFDPSLLSQIFSAVRHDGRGEDDCLLAVSVADRRYVEGQQLKGGKLRAILADEPTTVRADAQLDNLFFGPGTEAEYLGKAMSWDFLREQNLSLADAEKISTHNPVWGEFRTREFVAQ